MCAEKITGLTHFFGIEEENTLINMANLEKDFFFIQALDELFMECMELKAVDDSKLRLPVFLYLIVHNEFYLAASSFLRLHKSKSFLSLRIAMDATFTAYYLLKHPEKENTYLSGEKNLETGEKNTEWNKIFRNIKKTIKDNIEEFPLAKDLPEMHEICSAYAHADALGIMHKYNIDKGTSRLEAKYFDYDNVEDFKESYANLILPFYYIFLIFWAEIFKNLAGERAQIIEKKIAEFILNFNFFKKHKLKPIS